MKEASSSSGEHALRAILCFSFDHRAPQGELKSFKQALIDSPHVLHSIELSGTFDFIVEIGVPDLAAYHQKMDGMSGEIQKLVLRYEASFVCRRFPKRPPQVADARQDDGIWVPFEQGFRRLEMVDVRMVTAERDYVRIHAQGASYLLHGTITSFAEKLDPEIFLRIHRSTIIRRDLIEQLLHQKRRWSARLVDGSTHRISKSRANEVLQLSTPKGAREPVNSSNAGPG